MNRFLSEIQGKYMKIVKNANLIGFLNRLAVSFNLTDSQPLDNDRYYDICKNTDCMLISILFICKFYSE